MRRDIGSVALNSAEAVHYALISIYYTLLLYRQLFAQIKYFMFFCRNIFQKPLYAQLKPLYMIIKRLVLSPYAYREGGPIAVNRKQHSDV